MQTDSDDATRRRLTAVLDCLPHPTILVRPDLIIEAANQRFRSVYAGEREIRGRPCHEVSHGSPRPCDLPGEECPLLRCRRSGEPRRAFHVHSTPRGPEHVAVTVRPVRNSAGKVTSFVETFRRSTIASAEPRLDRLVGRSPAFNRMLDRVERVARGDSSVLLTGEPGSGREAVARALHQLSCRSRRPFLPVDCSGARQPRFEADLFGSADDDRAAELPLEASLLEAARGGTIYLNEIGEVPAAAQARLLRALETWKFRRSGGWRSLETDFRLICSASSDPQSLVDEGRLMPELLLRVGGLSIRVPSLRERKDDLELLIETELRRLEGCRGCRLGEGTLAALRAYTYPGNLRELGAVVQHACVLATDGVILPEHLPRRLAERRPPSPTPG